MKNSNFGNNEITRRKMLKYTGTGVAAGLLSSVPGKCIRIPLPRPDETISPSGMKGKIPMSLIIDDGSPVDPLFYELPWL